MRIFWRLLIIANISFLSACDSPEEQARQYLVKGEALLLAGEPVKAELEFKNALQIDDKLSPAWYGLAQVAKMDSDWSDTFSLLDRVVEIDPQNLDAHIEKVRLLLGAGQLERALEVSTASLQLAPDDARVLALRAAIIYTLKDIEGSVDLARRALQADPENADALVVLATERLQSGDVAQALEYLDRGISHHEKNVALQLIKIEALNRIDRVESSEAVLKNLIEIYPETDAFHYLLARFYLEQLKEGMAERIYRDLVVARPEDSRPRMELVRFINRTRGASAAIEELAKLIELAPSSTDLRFMMVQLQHRTGDNEGAVQNLEAIGETATSLEQRHKAQGLLAVYYLANRQYDQAMLLLDSVLTDDPRNEQALLIKSYRLIDEGNFSEAISSLRRVLSDDPDSARALFLLGKAHELGGMKDLAEDRYFRAFEASAQAPQFGLPLAKFLVKLQRPQRAEQVLEKVITSHPGHADSLTYLANLRIATEDWDGAQAAVNLVREHVGEAAADEVQGALYAAQKDYTGSIAAFKRAYQASPSSERILQSLVGAYLSSGRSKDAHQFLDSKLQASKEEVSTQLLKGQVYLSEGEVESAIHVFSRVLESHPLNTAAYLYISQAKQRTGDLEEALATLNRGLALVPGDFNLNLAKAVLLERRRVYDEAIASYESLLDARPNADIVVNNLASLLSEYRDDRESLQRAHELARRFQNSDIPHFKDTLGWTYYRLGKVEDARSFLEGAVRQTPTMPVFRYHLGMTYLALQENELARRELQLALDLGPEDSFPFRDEVKAAMRRL
ncbi:tetratricopeptide repeat protein [Microbulbifer mangrovi]|uniref:tetratricopeptide repeat protein n=1 Tax=Microbulbifer mangrovi TaxID=927787 RepID=UPI00099089F6|nr:tetratricopeptide repeat protein [Microbulbifer mangrovi]